MSTNPGENDQSSENDDSGNPAEGDNVEISKEEYQGLVDAKKAHDQTFAGYRKQITELKGEVRTLLDKEKKRVNEEGSAEDRLQLLTGEFEQVKAERDKNRELLEEAVIDKTLLEKGAKFSTRPDLLATFARPDMELHTDDDGKAVARPKGGFMSIDELLEAKAKKHLSELIPSTRKPGTGGDTKTPNKPGDSQNLTTEQIKNMSYSERAKLLSDPETRKKYAESLGIR